MKIVFPVQVYQKLRMYVDNIESEVSGFGRVEIIDDVVRIEDIKIFNQTVSGADTKLEGKDIAKFILSLPKDERVKWKLWWHSHADMETFFSGIDTATISDFDSEMPEDNWMVSMVTNHKGDYKTRIDMFAPFRYTIDDVEFEVDYNDEKLLEQIKAEIAEKVTEPAPYVATYPLTKNFQFQNDDNFSNWNKKKRKNGSRNGEKITKVKGYTLENGIMVREVKGVGLEDEEESQDYLNENAPQIPPDDYGD